MQPCHPMSHKHLYIGVAILLCLASSCKQKNVQGGMDDSAFVFETENIKGNEADYSRSAVITGHISHREVYPNTTEISIEIPFYDRVSEKQTSAIYEDAFAFSYVPYDGIVRDVKVIRGAHELLDAEALRVISASPRWEPGIQHGEAVPVTFIFPVIFQLR